MKWSVLDRQTRLSFIAAAVLICGLAGAIAVYFTAADDSENLAVYEFEQSKIYRHDLELYGGKLNVLLSEFMRWFGGLWHGKSFAFTIAFISFLISGLIFFAAKLLHTDHDSDHEGPRAP